MKYTDLFLLIILLTGFIAGCSDSSNPWFFETDYSTVPEPADTSGISPVTTEDGLTWYVIREGDGRWTITGRDILRGFRTLRTADGEIRQSTWANDNTTPENIDISALYENATEGLYQGVLGMSNGELRVIVVPPELAYGDVPNHPFREDTLIYEVEVLDILQR